MPQHSAALLLAVAAAGTAAAAAAATVHAPAQLPSPYGASASGEDNGTAACDANKKAGYTFTGSAIVVKLEDLMPASMVFSYCCGLASSVHAGGVSAKGYPWTVTTLGPSKKHKGETLIICTIYEPKGAKMVAAPNATTFAGWAPQPPPPPPPPACDGAKFQTMATCPAYCSWVNPGKCAAAPPAEMGCGAANLPPGKWTSNEPSLCINLVYSQAPFGDSAAGAAVNGTRWRQEATMVPHNDTAGAGGVFNWTSGQVTQYAKILHQPAQTLPAGDSSWFSFGSGFIKNATAKNGYTVTPWSMSVLFTLLDAAGHDTKTHFAFGLSVTEVGFDIAGPTGSADMAYHVEYKSGTYYHPAAFYPQVVVWKNTTSVHV